MGKAWELGYGLPFLFDQTVNPKHSSNQLAFSTNALSICCYNNHVRSLSVQYMAENAKIKKGKNGVNIMCAASCCWNQSSVNRASQPQWQSTTMGIRTYTYKWRENTPPDISLLIFKVNQLKYRQDSVQTFAFGH